MEKKDEVKIGDANELVKEKRFKVGETQKEPLSEVSLLIC